MATSRSQPTLGEYLVREGIITQKQFDDVLAQQRKTLHSVGRILVEMGLITEIMRISILQKSFGYELANLKNVRVEPGILALIPYNFAEKHRVVPIRRGSSGELIVAMEDPTDLLIIDAIKNQVGLEVEPMIASLEDIRAVLKQYPPTAQAPASEATRRKFRDTMVYKILKYGTFPVVALTPLVLFFVALWYDLWGIEQYVREYFQQSMNPTFEMFFYIALIWGLWTIIWFEICGLIFGIGGGRRDEEE